MQSTNQNRGVYPSSEATNYYKSGVNIHHLTLEKEHTRRSEEITSPVQVINLVFIAGTYGFQQAWTSQSFMRS
ncbi:hypothetical protein A2U01_0025316 [Trifolium medium]|uniref:Uncharacterized protein n=1 Tax=Trifolium medium TaxID=97028 RepID=A0A392NYD3_9FABA|nr:hypothetical protein [Trifolium medium]